MSTIADLGNGIGYIYVTDTETTTDIKFNIPNDEAGARAAKLIGIQSSNIASNLQAVGTITVGTPSGTGNITAININGVKQNKNNIAFTVASTPTEIANASVVEINNTTPGSGADYTAININEVIYLFAPESSGDSVNGDVVAVSISANLTVDTTDIVGGSDANSYSYDNRSGYRFFIDATSTAALGTNSGDEITDFICQRGLETGIPIIAATIADGAITITRQASIMYVVVDTEGAAGTDDLDSINPVGFANGDLLYILGTSASRVVTVTNSGNIVTQGAVNFDTGNFANVIQLAKSGASWYEQSKSTTAVPTAAQFRTANFPFLSSTAYGSISLSPADNTTVTLTANSSTQRQVASGSATLTTGNYVITCSTTGAKKGDWFLIQYDAQITVGSYDVIIGDLTLTDADALSGGIIVLAYYEGTVWQYSHFKDFGSYAKVQTADIASNSVTVAKVESSLQKEVVTLTAYFDADKVAKNGIEMPYAGTVTKITAVAQTLITDSSTITPKDNSNTVMTDGTITFSTSDPTDTARTSSPSANNTFVAGDYIYFETNGTTLGTGQVLISVSITRS